MPITTLPSAQRAVIQAVLDPVIPAAPTMLERNIYSQFYAAIRRGPATVGLSPRRIRALETMALYYQDLETLKTQYLQLLELLNRHEEVAAVLAAAVLREQE